MLNIYRCIRYCYKPSWYLRRGDFRNAAQCFMPFHTSHNIRLSYIQTFLPHVSRPSTSPKQSAYSSHPRASAYTHQSQPRTPQSPHTPPPPPAAPHYAPIYRPSSTLPPRHCTNRFSLAGPRSRTLCRRRWRLLWRSCAPRRWIAWPYRGGRRAAVAGGGGRLLGWLLWGG